MPTSTDWDDTGLPLNALDQAMTHPWGVAYVYDHTRDGWSHIASLENPDREAQSHFGRDLTINAEGTTVVVGAYLANQTEQFVSVNDRTIGTPGPASDQGVVTHHPSTGAAYVFERAGDWTCSAQLTGDDTDTGEGEFGDDFFGSAVAVTGSTLWIGAPNNGPDRQGSAYAFQAAGPAPELGPASSQGRCGPR